MKQKMWSRPWSRWRTQSCFLEVVVADVGLEAAERAGDKARARLTGEIA